MRRRSPAPPGVQRVCLVTPVRNGADYLDQTIASVLTQAGDFVLHYHVQDGGSTDGTDRLVRRWLRRHRLRLLPRACRDIVFTYATAPDAGMYDAINKGFAAALPPGDDVVMGWIAADDQLAPGCFSTLTTLRAAFPDIRLMGGRMALLDEHGSINTIAPARAFSSRAMAAGLYDGRGGRAFVMQEGTFWCSDLWHRVRGLDPAFALAGDWDLWRRMAALEDYVTVDTALGLHRRRPGQLSEQMDRYYAEIDTTLNSAVRYQDTATADPALIEAGVVQAGTILPLRRQYDAVAEEYERLGADAAGFRASGHAATLLKYETGLRAWTRVDGFGAARLDMQTIDQDGCWRHLPVLPCDGLGPPEEARLELGLADGMRWLRGSEARGEAVLARDGRHILVLRYRAWHKGMTAVFMVDGVYVARRPIPAHGHEREIELRVEVRLRAGRRCLTLRIEDAPPDGGTLIVTAWRVEEAIEAPLHHPPAASVRWPPQQGGRAWPRISVVIAAGDKPNAVIAAGQRLLADRYPNLELVLAVSPSASVEALPRDFNDVLVLQTDATAYDEVLAASARHLTGEIAWVLGAGDMPASGALHGAALAFDDAEIVAVAGVIEVLDAHGTVVRRIMPASSDPARAQALLRRSGSGFAFDDPAPVAVRRIGRHLLTTGNPPSGECIPPLLGTIVWLPASEAAPLIEDRYSLLRALHLLGAVPSFDDHPTAYAEDGAIAPQAWSDTARQTGPTTDQALFRPDAKQRARMLLGLPADAFVVVVPKIDARTEEALATAIRTWSGDRRLLLLDLGTGETRLRVKGGALHQTPGGRALLLQAGDVLVSDLATSALTVIEAAAVGTPRIGLVFDADDTPATVNVPCPDPIAIADLDATLRHIGRDHSWGCEAAWIAQIQAGNDCGPASRALAFLEEAERRGIVPAGSASNAFCLMADEPGPLAGPASCRASWLTVASESDDAAILVHSDYAGTFIVQIMSSDMAAVDADIRVNDSAAVASRRSTGSQDARFEVHLNHGLNRIGPADATIARLWIAAIEDVALWPDRQNVADIAFSGTVDIASGFGDREPPDIAGLLPRPFSRLTALEGRVWLASSSSHVRDFEVRLRNSGQGQHVTVRLGGEIAGQGWAQDGVAHLTTIRCRARFDRGWNPLAISCARIGMDDAGRPLAFYLEDVGFSTDLDGDDDPVIWTESSGFGPLEAPVAYQNLPAPFHWMEADHAALMVEVPQGGRARLVFHIRLLGPRQTITLASAGLILLRDTFEGQALQERLIVEIDADLSAGRNRIDLYVDVPGTHREGRDLYLLLESLRLADPVDQGPSDD